MPFFNTIAIFVGTSKAMLTGSRGPWEFAQQSGLGAENAAAAGCVQTQETISNVEAETRMSIVRTGHALTQMEDSARPSQLFSVELTGRASFVGFVSMYNDGTVPHASKGPYLA